MSLDNVIARLTQVPNVFIDSGLRQGRDAVLAQLRRRSGHDEIYGVEEFMSSMQEGISDLKKRALPYEVPPDYVSFLETYGGMALLGEDGIYRFSIYGLGPWVEEHYSAIDSDEVILNAGDTRFLSLGSLDFRLPHRLQRARVRFFCDLSGIFGLHAVIGVGPRDRNLKDDIGALTHPNQIDDSVRRVADSFTQWLNVAAITRGLFGYQ